jgi:dynein heavy chain
MAATSELHELQRRSAVERMLEFETVLKDSAAARLSTAGGPARMPSEISRSRSGLFASQSLGDLRISTERSLLRAPPARPSVDTPVLARDIARPSQLPPLRSPPAARLPPTALRPAAGPAKAPYSWPVGRSTPPVDDAEALPQFLPLADFFEPDADPCSAEVFLRWKTAGRVVKAVSKWSDPVGDRMRPCTVLDYDEVAAKFLIEWDGTTTTKYVGRQNLIFALEDREAFDRASALARQTRAVVEAELRYAHRVESMRVPEGIRVPQDTLDRISARAGIVTHRGRRWLPGEPPTRVLTPLQMEVLDGLALEIAADNGVALNKIEFDARRVDTFSSSMFRHLPPAATTGSWVTPLDDVVKSLGGRDKLQPFNRRVAELEKAWPRSNTHLATAADRVWTARQHLSTLSMQQEDLQMPCTLHCIAEAYAGARADATAEMRAFIRFELPDIVEDAYSREDLHAEKSTEDQTLRMYHKFLALCRQQLRAVSLSVLRREVNDLVALFAPSTASDPNDPPGLPVFLVDVVIDSAGRIKPAVPLHEYKAAVAQMIDATAESVMSLQDVEAAFLPPPPPDVPSSSDALHAEPSRYSDEISSARSSICASIQQEVRMVDRFFEDKLMPFEFLLRRDPTSYAAALERKMSEHDPSGVCTEEMQVYENAGRSIQAQLSGECRTRLFDCNVSSIRERLLDECRLLSGVVLDCLKQVCNSNIAVLEQTVADIQSIITREIETPEHFREVREYVEKAVQDQEDRDCFPKMNEVMSGFQTLEHYSVVCTEEELRRQWTAFKHVSDMKSQLVTRSRSLFADRDRLQKRLEKREQKLKARGADLLNRLVAFDGDCDLTTIEEYEPLAIEKMQKDMTAITEMDRLCREHRAILCDVRPDELRCLLPYDLEAFESKVDLWNLASSWSDHYHGWMATRFDHLNAEKMQRTVTRFQTDVANSLTQLRADLDAEELHQLPKNHPVTIATELYQHVEQVHYEMPFIKKLRHPGIRSRHWSKIEALIGYDIRSVFDLSVADVTSMEFDGKKYQVAEILSAAMSEYALEYGLDKMQEQLDSLQFIIDNHDDDNLIADQTSCEKMVEIIDGQYVEAQSLMLSPFVGSFASRASGWIAYIKDLNSFTELLIDCQANFLYYLPLFSAGDVTNLIPEQAQSFRHITKRFQKVAEALQVDSYLVHVPQRPELRAELLQCRELFDGLKGGMSVLLDAKRKGFARLYFMSDRDILDMMSQTASAPHLLGSYVHKCFDGIFNLAISRSKDSIEALCSQNGEQVFLSKPVLFLGTVTEVWMANLEKEMRRTMALVTKQAVASIREIAPERRLFDWPLEAAMLAHETYFTNDAEASIAAGQPRALQESRATLSDRVATFAKELNMLPGKSSLTPLQRNARTSQLLLLLKFRDTLAELIRNKVTSVDDFVWRSNLRYYVPDEGGIHVECCMYRVPYGFEFLGGKSRLVMTEMTRRAVATTMGALHCHLGASLIGQPGTPIWFFHNIELINAGIMLSLERSAFAAC